MVAAAIMLSKAENKTTYTAWLRISVTSYIYIQGRRLVEGWRREARLIRESLEGKFEHEPTGV